MEGSDKRQLEGLLQARSEDMRHAPATGSPQAPSRRPSSSPRIAPTVRGGQRLRVRAAARRAGDEIGTRRLRAMPRATLCLDCQRSAEQAAERYLDSGHAEDARHRRGRVHRLARRARARRARRRAAPDGPRLDQGRRTSPGSSTRRSSATCSTVARSGARCSDVDRVFHCAGMTSLRSADAERLFEVNVIATRNLLEECLRAEVERVVYTSSVAAIGPARGGRAARTRTSSSRPGSSGSRT